MGLYIDGEKIRQARENAGITLAELAEKLNIKKQSWQRIEKQKKAIKEDLLQRFAQIVNTSPDEFLSASAKKGTERMDFEHACKMATIIAEELVSRSLHLPGDTYGTLTKAMAILCQYDDRSEEYILDNLDLIIQEFQF